MPKALVQADVDQVVDAWFAFHFRSSVLSRDTAVYNAAIVAQSDLKAKLGALIGAPPAQPLTPLKDGETQ